MIYLFNSAYRALYTRNVLNTLFIPQGGTNEYRYTVQLSIAPDSYETLKNSPSGTPVVIVFIDRFAKTGYRYHPLRLATLVKPREDAGRLYFRVRLGDFVAPRDSEAFNRDIVKCLGSMGLPSLKDNDPYRMDDGYYAIEAGRLFARTPDFLWGEDGWRRTVDELRQTQAFGGPVNFVATSHKDDIEKKEFLFLRCDIRRKSTDSRGILPRLRNDRAVFDLIRGARYEFLLSYCYPSQQDNPTHTGIIEGEFGENLRTFGSSAVNVDSSSNSVALPFATKRHLEDYEDGVTFKFRSNQSGYQLIGPDSRLSFEFKESRLFWLQLGIVLLLFSLLTAFIGLDLSRISPLTASAAAKAVWPKFVAGFLQAGVLFWMFRLVGKKFL